VHYDPWRPVLAVSWVVQENIQSICFIFVVVRDENIEFEVGLCHDNLLLFDSDFPNLAKIVVGKSDS
jgi:hypothetical protein